MGALKWGMAPLFALWLVISVSAALTVFVLLAARSRYSIRDKRQEMLNAVIDAALLALRAGAASGPRAVDVEIARLRAVALLRADVGLDAENVALWTQRMLSDLAQASDRKVEGLLLIERLEPLLNPLTEWASMRRSSWWFKTLPAPFVFDPNLGGPGENLVTRSWNRSTTVTRKPKA